MDCYACAHNAGFDSLPPRELIAADEWWRVAHDFSGALLGWLVLVPRRHVTSIGALTDDEARTLGTWQVRLSRALSEVTGCEKTYVMQFAEKPGFAHVHFHVVPRRPDLPPDRRGPAVLRYADPAANAPLTDVQRDDCALAVRAALGVAGPGQWRVGR
ncbi:HIT family protein [Cryptosporangium phraense]|uniref:HIT family protein n=1 Tax=Cryptosporangium phraense TaxID=2593070 RepID=A0A545ATV1_9ACTN|nr:HIT family protein [Cryptosporangium phraense]TQS44025.1 HIT family protein [Cryptosporangium phraense]